MIREDTWKCVRCVAREFGIRLLLLLIRIVTVGETFAELAASFQFVGHVLLSLCLCHGTSVIVLFSLLLKDMRTSLSLLLRCDLIVVLFLLGLLLLLVVYGRSARFSLVSQTFVISLVSRY